MPYEQDHAQHFAMEKLVPELGITLVAYDSHIDGAVVVEVEGGGGRVLRIYVNDGKIFDKDPDT